MGYTTKFYGTFKLNKTLSPEQVMYLLAFSESRRVKRDAKLVEKMKDPLRVVVGLPVGEDGEYFVTGGSNPSFNDKSIIKYNDPPANQPGLWCQWVPNQLGNYDSCDGHAPTGTEIGWNGGEKFYEYIDWLKYIIEHFLKPWGYILNGEVEWEGERRTDLGMILVQDNVVTTKVGAIVYRTEDEWIAEVERVVGVDKKAKKSPARKDDQETVQLTEKGKRLVTKPKKVTVKKTSKKR